MKRTIAVLLLTSFLAPAAFAQDAVALAAQREQEENVKRLAATVDEVQTAQANIRKMLSELSAEIDRLRDDVAKSKNNAATQDAIKRLSDQILKVDESRIADNKRVQDGLDKIQKLVTQAPVVVAPPPRSEPKVEAAVPPRPRTEKGFEYTVKSGDHLGVIVKLARDQGVMVTSKMIQDANPGVVWEKLRIGQKIFIPEVK